MRAGVKSVGIISLAAALAAACDKSDSVVVVKVAAETGIPDVMQLRAFVSNAGEGAMRDFPTAPAATPIVFETSFSLTVPRERTGALDIALDAIGAGGAVVANGAGTVDLHVGDNVTVTIMLRAGPSLCGNSQVDTGEVCDDGDRYSSGTCDFQCQPIGAGPGVGGSGGTAGSAGTGGTAGTGGAGATGGAAGTGAAGRGGTGGGGIGGTGAAGRGGTGGGGRGGTGGGRGGIGGGCTIELLTNGNFEAGNAGWTIQSPNGRELIYRYTDVDPTIAPPAQSIHIAWLGYDQVNANLTNSVLLSQAIQIPANAVSFTVSGSVFIQSEDSPTTLYDFAYVETLISSFVDPEGNWSNVDQGGTSWRPFSVTHTPAGAAGASAIFQIRVIMDDAGDTSFFFDNLSFAANVCP